MMDGRENLMDGRENWHKKIVMDGRENWHKKIVMIADNSSKIRRREPGVSTQALGTRTY